MPVLVGLVSASIATLLFVVTAETLSRVAVVGDTERTERWLVGRIAAVPGLRRVVALADRRVWGGAMVGTALLALLGAGAAVGWILSTVDDECGFARFDLAVANWGSEHATAASTAVLRGVTHLGDTVVLIGLSVAIGLLAAARASGSRWSMLGFLLTVGVGVSLVNNGLKWLVLRDRPGVEHLAGSGGSSFPSGHTAAAAACWAAIAIVVSRRMGRPARRWVMASAVAIAVLVATSRVMLGVHWLTDVIAGLLVGWTWCFVVALVFGGRIQRFGEPAERVQAATFEGTVTGTTVPSSHHHHNNDHHNDHHHDHDQRADTAAPDQKGLRP